MVTRRQFNRYLAGATAAWQLPPTLAASYSHGGFAGEQRLVLRPIGEQAGCGPGAVATWLQYRRAGPGAP